MERPWHLLLRNELLLVPVIGAERILGVAMCLQALIHLSVEPLSIRFVFEHRHLMVFVTLETLVDLVNTVHVSVTHCEAFNFLFGLFFIESNSFIAVYLSDKFINLSIFVNNFLHRFKLAYFLLFDKVILLWFLSSNSIYVEAFTLKLVMLHELIGSTVICIPFVKDVLTHLVKGLGDVQIEREKSFDNFCVYLVIFVIQLLFLYEVQVVWQILGIPNVVLNLLESDPLYRVRLKHPVDKVLNFRGKVVGDKVPTLFDLTK